MLNFTILAGGYTTFLTRFVFMFDPVNPYAGSQLIDTGAFDAGNDPSWITLNPLDPSVLYTTQEVTVGGVLSFKLAGDGTPTLMDNKSSDGNGPAFAGTYNGGKDFLALNYGSGNASFIGLQDLNKFGPELQGITFPPPPTPGGVSHPHFFLPHNEELLLVDLGADKVWRLSQSPTNNTWSITGFIPQPTGSGPRRAAIFGDTIYVLHEEFNIITEQHIPVSPSSTEAPILATELTFTPGPGVNTTNLTFAAAELLAPPPSSSFPTQFLYASNRGLVPPFSTDSVGDTIAIFSLNPLKKINEVQTGLHQIRGMEFGGPEDRFLIAGGVQNPGGNGVAVFERTEGGASLRLLARNNGTDAQLRSSFVWL